MIHGAWFDGERFSEDHHTLADLEAMLHKGQIPPPAMQPGGAVLNHHFKYRLSALAEILQALNHNAALNDGGLVEDKIVNGKEMAAIFITPRAQQQ
jgi:hypothetical protein